jgi:hypothetical protein
VVFPVIIIVCHHAVFYFHAVLCPTDLFFFPFSYTHPPFYQGVWISINLTEIPLTLSSSTITFEMWFHYIYPTPKSAKNLFNSIITQDPDVKILTDEQMWWFYQMVLQMNRWTKFHLTHNVFLWKKMNFKASIVHIFNRIFICKTLYTSRRYTYLDVTHILTLYTSWRRAPLNDT